MNKSNPVKGIYKFIALIMVFTLMVFVFTNLSVNAHEGHSNKADTKSKTVEKQETTKSNVNANVSVSNLLNSSFVNLVDGKNYDLKLSDESLVFFLNKETVRDYVQINNFKEWLTKKGYNNVQFVVFVNGKETEKNELMNLVKTNKLEMALWPTSNVVSSLGVKEYPTVYYIVNGKVVGTTNKLDQGHLKQLVGWCEHCSLTKAKDKCNAQMKNDKQVKEKKMKEKSCKCGSGCNCGCETGKECKCGK